MSPSVGGGSSYAGSSASSASSASQRVRHANQQQDGQGSDLLDRRSTLENGVFGVLFTLSKENSETRIRIRWVLLKILLDGWQLFATVIQPAKQGWDIDPDGAAWSVVSVLNFTWLGNLSYSAYLALLYSAVALLVLNIGLCVWVAWCFKEQKFPVVWPIKVLRVFSSIFFQAFDVASLNLLQLGFSCHFTGPSPHMHMDLFPAYSCAASPHMIHAVVSGIFLLLFVVIALLLNMAEVEVNPLSRRPMALGHSGAEVMAFAIKALLTLVDVFLGWRKVAACAYLALSLALAWQYLRWNPNLVAWVNYLKAGVSGSIVWCCVTLMLLVFAPGVKASEQSSWSSAMTITMLAGLAPAFVVGAVMSWFFIRKMTSTALQAMADAKPEQPLQDICDNLDDPRDVEVVARSARVWRDRYTLDPDAVQKAHNIIKAGLAMFPGSAYMVLLHADFMIDVLGVSQSGARRIEDARKLNPSLMCRFMMFVRQQQATQKAAGSHANDGVSMDLLGYVEYQRKQRMVVRLHREALQAMCNFWKALDASRVSFTHLSKALGKIESSVSQAQAAYRVVLESYGTNPKLIRLYGKFLEKIKNDPWGAAEYFAEADRLEEVKNGDARGPLLPDGTPLGRMDEMAAAVLVINATGEIQMANKQTHNLFGHKRGTLEAKPLATLLAPHCARRVSEELARMVANSSVVALMSGGRTESGRSTDASIISEGPDLVVVGMHVDRVAFSVKLSLRKASGVGEDSTFIALLEPAPPVPNMAKIWVSPNGIVAAADPQFVAHFGWKATEVNGSNLTALMLVQSTESVVLCGGGKGEDEEVAVPKTLTESATETIKRLLWLAKVNGDKEGKPVQGLQCLVAHKYDSQPVPCTVTVVESTSAEISVHELRLQLASDDPAQLLVVNRKGVILHASTELASALKDSVAAGAGSSGPRFGGVAGSLPGSGMAAGGALNATHNNGTGFVFGADLLTGFTLCDFLPAPWKDMHVRFLKDITSSSPPTRSLWSCRKAAPGVTLELHTMTGRPLYMQVAVTTGDLNGESTHVISLQRSSLEAALSERRVRLTVSEDGLVSASSQGLALQMLGLEPSRIIGRGLWEVVSEEPADAADTAAVRASTPGGPRMLAALVERALSDPGASWRVDVSNPLPRKSCGGPALTRQQSAKVRAKAAVMQVNLEPPSDEEAAAGQGNHVYVDLWPLHAVSGVLQLDAVGRVTSVLEEHTRPAGLLFGLHHDALVGEALSSLVTMPPGRTSAAELLSLHGAKKSNLKTKQKDVAVKVGPVHKLRATHTDGKPLVLDVQVVGKPGPNQPLTAILRLHATPMMPAATARAPAAPPPPSRAVDGVKGGTAAAETAAASGAAAVATAIKRKPSLDDLLDKVEAAEGAAAGKVAAGARNSKESFSVGQVHTPPTDGSLRRRDSTVMKASSGTEAVAAAAAAGGLEDTGVAPPPPPMPAILLAGVSNGGLPVPGVTAAAAATGRNKLADLVKSVGSEQQAAGSGKMVLGSGDGSLPPAPRTRPGISRRSNNGDGGGSVVAADLPHVVPPEAGGAKEEPAETAAGVDVQSVDGEDKGDDMDSEGGSSGQVKGADRILSWVASKGAFYQNSVAAKTDEDGSVKAPSEDAGSDIHASHSDMTGAAYAASERTERTVATVATMATAHTLAGLKSAAAPDMPYADDDAASEGGQSAMSAQSASGGAEYKRGKRFRKLVKLMDSGQAQQVQKRFKLHALVTVGVLAAVHVVCFALTVVSIGQQRASMLQLGRSGELQLSLHQILADVRSLDIIVQNKTLPTLYTASDSPMFLDRIAVNVEKIKDRLNEILQNHHDRDSMVMSLFYFTTIKVWNGRDQNGSDTFTNTTIWDFGTRIYSMTKLVEQNGAQWLADGLSFVDQDPGQFLIKSGPDFFRASRRILDALLYTAVDSAKKVNTLQLVFLAVEGAAISCAAACYLAYLLRAVAAQRYKLYGTFLVIPVGLTRALASQNTTLLVDEDEDEDEDEEEDRAATAQANNDGSDGENEDGGKPATKQKRTLGFSASALTPTADTPGGGGSKGAGGAGPRKKAAPWDVAPREGARVPAGAVRGSDVLLGGDDDDGASGLMAHQRTYTGSFNSSRSRGGLGGCWGWVRRLMFRSRSLGSVAPLPSTRLGSILGPRGWAASTQQAVAASAQQAQGGASSNSKRTLKYDSHDTAIMLTPFVMWSVLVIAFYATAVVKMRDIVDTVAVHSVVNFMSARTSRNVFLSQELAVVEDPAQVPAKQLALQAGVKLVRDAFYTLQLGSRAYLTAGNATERYPLVTTGLSHASPQLEDLFYGSGTCHRQFPEYLPCPGPEYRYYEISHTGFDTMMQQFLISLEAMAFNVTGLPQGLGNKNFDYIYNVGYKDMIGAILQIKQAHYNIIVALFDRIMLLHIILFLMLWVIFAGFLFILLNPLIKRVSKERRRIAELMSQLPLELDVEKLVGRALGTGQPPQGGVGGVMSSGPSHTAAAAGGGAGAAAPGGRGADATSKWKAIIKQASTNFKAGGKRASADQLGNVA